MNSKTRKFSCGYDKKVFFTSLSGVLPVFTRNDSIGISGLKIIENLEFSSGSQYSHKSGGNNSHKKVSRILRILRIYFEFQG